MNNWRSKILYTYAIMIIVFLYLPIALLAIYSFNSSRINAVWVGFTFDWYLSLFKNTRVLDAFLNSMVIAVVSTIISTTIGTMAAISLNRYKFKHKNTLNALVYLPMLIPEIVLGLSLLVMFSQTNVELGKTTLILSHITFSLSFVIITVSARLEGMHIDFEEAASDLYATPWQTFRYVTFPIALPGIVAGALMAFTLSIDDFVISFFVAGPNSTTLPLYVYAMVKRGISPEINALSTIMIVATVTLVLLGHFMQSKNENNKEN